MTAPTIRVDIHDRFECVRRLAMMREAPMRTVPAPRFLAEMEPATTESAQDPVAPHVTPTCTPPLTQTKYQRYHNRLRAEGRCERCGGPPAPGRHQCQRHIDTKRARRRGRALQALTMLTIDVAAWMDSTPADPAVRAGTILLIVSGWVRPRLRDQVLAAWAGWSIEDVRAAVQRFRAARIPVEHWADDRYGHMTFVLSCLAALGLATVEVGPSAAEDLWFATPVLLTERSTSASP